MNSRQYILMILDGVGCSDETEGNAFRLANTPTLDNLMIDYPTSRIKTSGLAVGLPDGQMGNSEVGHTNIGAGRIVYQELTHISREIKKGDFFQNETLLLSFDNAKKQGRSLHLMGLVSDGGVHSHINHLYALLEMAKKHGIKNVFVHAFLDGRDTLPSTAAGFIEDLESKMQQIGVGKIATLGGRYYGMDRDNRWDRVQLAYDAMTIGAGDKFLSSSQAIKSAYSTGLTDEFIKPVVIVNKNEEPVSLINDGDSIVFFNFRPDRARQITRAFVDDNFSGFERNSSFNNLNFTTITDYDSTLKSVNVVYKPQSLANTLGEYVSKQGFTQLRIAETEKYAHVTFFFNGGGEKQYNGEDRVLVPSPQVATYDLKPEMSAVEVTDKIVEAINDKKYNLIVVNFANGDMVGHTGKLDKAVIAVETLDKCVQRIVDKLKQVDGEAIITADHGNCEYMINPKTDDIITSHSNFDVPIIVVSNRVKNVKAGKLCDIAPTLLALMGQVVPSEMTGDSLIEFNI